jgi:two-component system, chemotaxis family, CheB/CheR fusion protein
VRAAREFKPEAALLDIGLPVVNGYEVARQLKQLPGCEHILLIAVSGYAQEEDLQRSQEAGIQHHFAKPVDLDVLGELLAVDEQPGATAGVQPEHP